MPVFVDIRPDTLNLDEKQLAAALGPRTRAIVPVHYAGVGCEMDAIMREASAGGSPVVEDNAHGLFGKYKGRYLGTFGVLAAQSFHETKNFSCGEGGALIVNDDEPARSGRDHPREGNEPVALLPRSDRQVHVGGRRLILPAVGYPGSVPVRPAGEQGSESSRCARTPGTHTQPDFGTGRPRTKCRCRTCPDDCEQPFHMFYLLMPNLEVRTRFIAHLAGAR